MFSEEFALLDAFKSHGACVDCFMVDVHACVSRAWIIFFKILEGLLLELLVFDLLSGGAPQSYHSFTSTSLCLPLLERGASVESFLNS